MEKYRKVTVFTPTETLEEISFDLQKIHDDILKEMFDDFFWHDFENYHPENIKYPVYEHHKRAAFLAYEVGFSVLYETENHLMFYFGDFITEEMIEYIKENYKEKREYISFGIQISNEEAEKKYYANEAFKENYSIVFDEMLYILRLKKVLQETKRKK